MQKSHAQSDKTNKTSQTSTAITYPTFPLSSIAQYVLENQSRRNSDKMDEVSPYNTVQSQQTLEPLGESQERNIAQIQSQIVRLNRTYNAEYVALATKLTPEQLVATEVGEPVLIFSRYLEENHRLKQDKEELIKRLKCANDQKSLAELQHTDDKLALSEVNEMIQKLTAANRQLEIGSNKSLERYHTLLKTLKTYEAYKTENTLVKTELNRIANELETYKPENIRLKTELNLITNELHELGHTMSRNKSPKKSNVAPISYPELPQLIRSFKLRVAEQDFIIENLQKKIARIEEPRPNVHFDELTHANESLYALSHRASTPEAQLPFMDEFSQNSQTQTPNYLIAGPNNFHSTNELFYNAQISPLHPTSMLSLPAIPETNEGFTSFLNQVRVPHRPAPQVSLLDSQDVDYYDSSALTTALSSTSSSTSSGRINPFRHHRPR